MQKKFKLLPKKKSQLAPEKIKISAEKIQNSAEKNQKITNRVDWILSKRVFDVLLCLLLRLKCWSARGASQHLAFTGNCTTISHMFFSLIYPVDEFSLKEMRMWGQSKISSYCFFVWCKSRELEGRRSSRFPCLTAVVGTFSERVAFRTL